MGVGRASLERGRETPPRGCDTPRRVRWVQFTIAPLAGIGDDMAREPSARYGRFRPEGGSLFLGLLLRPPSALSQTKLISDEQMDVLVVLGMLIALLAISGIVVWIYASELRGCVKARRPRWVQFAISPIVGFADDRVATKPALRSLWFASTMCAARR